MKSFNKDYFVSINDGIVVISKNPIPSLETYYDMMDLSKRYIYEVGQKILTPFGIQTIKEINKNYGTQSGYEWLILVEENENQYKPIELIGIVVNTMSLINFEILNGKNSLW